MANYDAVLLDFDGTFADTMEGILDSFNTVLAEYGMPLMEETAFRKCLGPPLLNSYQTLCGLDEATAEQAVALHREIYGAGSYMRLRVFDGMEALLQRLRAEGVKVAVASAKPTVFLEKILEGLGMRQAFDAVCGVGMNHIDEDKAGIVAEAVRQCGAMPSRCLMVGDRRYDIAGAKAVGTASAAVLYGFGSREELEQAEPDFLVKDCAELEQIIFGT